MKRFALILVVVFVVAACGGSSDSPETTTTTVGSGGTTSSTVPAEPGETTTSTAAPSGSGGGGGDDCIVGTWEMDSARFFEAIAATMTAEEAAMGTFTHVGGTYRVIIGADGSFTDQRNDWSFDVGSDEGTMNMTINHERTGTYEIDGDLVAVSLPGDVPADVALTIDGEPFVFPPGVPQPSPPAFEYDTAPVDCDGDSLILTGDEGIIVYWGRVG